MHNGVVLITGAITVAYFLSSIGIMLSKIMHGCIDHLSSLGSVATFRLCLCRGMQPHLLSLACARRAWKHILKKEEKKETLNIQAHTLIHTLMHTGATWTNLHQRYICFLCMFDGTGRQRLATAPAYRTAWIKYAWLGGRKGKVYTLQICEKRNKTCRF